METPLHNLVERAAPGERAAQMSADALGLELGAIVDAHAADIAEGHGLNFDATPAQSAGRGL